MAETAPAAQVEVLEAWFRSKVEQLRLQQGVVHQLISFTGTNARDLGHVRVLVLQVNRCELRTVDPGV